MHRSIEIVPIGTLQLSRALADRRLADYVLERGIENALALLPGAETAERARTSVTRSLRYALERLDRHHPTIATHLEHSVHTGTYCSYAPDPLAPIHWHI